MPSPSVDIRTTKTVRLRTAPDWLPEEYRQRGERIRLSFRPSLGERRFLRHKKVVPPSEWAPKNRVVTYGPLKGSRWDNEFMPHMRGVMDTLFFPSVRYQGNCKAPQTGSSSGAETCLGYVADRRPADSFVVYPDRDTTSKRSTDYLQPMFKDSPRLRPLLTGLSDDMASLRIKLLPMLIYMGWAGSLTSLGNISAKYLFGDEVDKWPRKSSKKEADNLSLFYERFRSFDYGAKCFLISTPSDIDGPIWQYMVKEAQVVFVYCIPCPECGEYHRASEKFIDFGGERDHRVIENSAVARYVFPCCGLSVNDRVRNKALNNGVWHALENGERDADGCLDIEVDRKKWQVPGRERMKYLKEEKPEKVCFHSPAIISKRFTHRQIAAAFLKGLKDPAAMHYYDNQIKAVAHIPFRQNRKEDVVRKLKDDRPAGLVPGNNQVAALVAGVDTQKDYFRLVIRAFGYGTRQKSWKIREAELKDFADIERAVFETEYKDAAGLYYPVHLVGIDTGGSRFDADYSRTTEVYNWARKHPSRVFAYKGASGRKAKPWSRTVIDYFPGTKTPIPGGLDLYICDHHFYKDQLASKLALKSDAPGAFLLDSETTEQYIAEMCAEYVNDSRLWVCPKNRQNHYWDCEVLCQIAADLLQLKFTVNPLESEQENITEEESVENG